MVRSLIAKLILMTVTAAVPVWAQDPDPVSLLRGVEESRRSVRSGRIELFLQYKQYLPPFPDGDGVKVRIQFQDEKRTLVQHMRVFVLSGKDPNQEANLKRMMATADYEAAIRAGIGKWENKTIYSTWDGTNCFQYGTGFGAGFKKHEGGGIDHLSDPRLLGLHANSVDETLEFCLPHRAGTNPTLFGRETIAGASAWHVSIKPHPEVEFHYWIEPERDFRLHRFEYRAAFRTDVRVSEFEGDAALPARMTLSSYTREKKLKREMLLRVDKVKLNVSVDADVGTYRSVGMPPGEPIADERIGQRLGFWDGEEIVDDLATAIRRGAEREAARLRKLRWRWAALVTAIGVALVFVGFGVRRRLRRASSPPSQP